MEEWFKNDLESVLIYIIILIKRDLSIFDWITILINNYKENKRGLGSYFGDLYKQNNFNGYAEIDGKALLIHGLGDIDGEMVKIIGTINGGKVTV